MQNCKSLYNGLSKILSKDEIKEMMKEKNSAGDVFHLAAGNPNQRLFSSLYECLKDVLTEEEIKSLILDIKPPKVKMFFT